MADLTPDTLARLRAIWDAIGAIEASADGPREHRLWAGDGDEIGRAFSHVGVGLTPEDVAFAFASGRALLDAAEERDRLREAVAFYLDMSDGGPLAVFEREAEAFYQATGYMAPGKSEPIHCGETGTYEEKVAAWNHWLAYRRSTMLWLARRALRGER